MMADEAMNMETVGKYKKFSIFAAFFGCAAYVSSFFASILSMIVYITANISPHLNVETAISIAFWVFFTGIMIFMVAGGLKEQQKLFLFWESGKYLVIAFALFSVSRISADITVGLYRMISFSAVHNAYYPDLYSYVALSFNIAGLVFLFLQTRIYLQGLLKAGN
jgi:hypothetical protein